MKWKKIKVHDVDIRGFINDGLSIDELKKWRAEGIKDDDIYRYKNAGISLNDLKWRKIGIPMADMVIYKAYGISYDEAKKWLKVGVDNANDIKKFKKAGITPSQLKK